MKEKTRFYKNGSMDRHLHKRYTLICAIVCSLFLSVMISTQGRTQETLIQGGKIGLEDCIHVALKNHPALFRAAGSIKAGESRVNQARSDYYPKVGASAVYSRNRSSDEDGDDDSAYNRYQGSVDLKQTILDFGKTSAQVQVRSWGAQASKADLTDVTRLVIFGVKQSFYRILQAKQAMDAYADTVRQLELHLDQATRFYQAGIRAKIEVTNAQVNLGQARLDLLTAENTVRIATVTLKNAMGIPEAPDFEVQETASGVQEYPIDLETAIRKSYENRPDLYSAEAVWEAAKSSVDVAKKGYYPVLSGNAGYGWAGRKSPLDDEWFFGASLDFPLFNGFLTRYQVREANAVLETAKANEKLIRQDIRYDVEQAFYTMKSVRERISLAELTMEQAKENRELALGRYASRVGSPMEVSDAVVSETKARTSYITAVYDYRIAVADLERAMGEN